MSIKDSGISLKMISYLKQFIQNFVHPPWLVLVILPRINRDIQTEDLMLSAWAGIFVFMIHFIMLMEKVRKRKQNYVEKVHMLFSQK